jgi:hypothetical protein
VCLRPLLFGYLRASPGRAAADIAAFLPALAAYAETEGFTVGGVFVEPPGAGGAAFGALLATLRRYEGRAVAVPAPGHLPAGICLDREAGARVVVVPPARRSRTR